MKKTINYLKKYELFLKIYFILLASILLLVLIISGVIYSKSKSSYINSYTHSNNILLDKIQDDYETLNQNIQTIFSQADNSKTVEDFLTKEPGDNRPEFNQTLIELNKEMLSTRKIYEDIPSNLILLGKNKQVFIQNDGVRTPELGEFLQSQSLREINESADISHFYYTKNGFTMSTQRSSGLVFIRKLQTTSKDTFGYALIFVPENYFASIYQELLDSNISTIHIINKENLVISATNKQQLGRKLPLAEQSSSAASQTTVGSFPLYSYDFKLISHIDEAALVSGMNIVKPTAIITLIVSLIVGVLAFLTLRRTTLPMYKLINALPEVTLALNQPLPEEGTYETKELAKSYNLMLKNLSFYLKDLVKSEADKRLKELEALQLQIQPHFIYNTLTSIKFLIWQTKNEEAIEAIDSFTALLRHTLSNQKETISIAEEIASVQEYINILALRFGDNIQTNIFCQPGLEQLLIPKMIIQPVIENAFLHAFPQDAEGHIQVFITQTDELLTIELIDNGVGFDTTLLASLEDDSSLKQRYTSIGLTNIDERLKILYGSAYGLVTTSIIGQGTQVTLTLPLVS